MRISLLRHRRRLSVAALSAAALLLAAPAHADNTYPDGAWGGYVATGDSGAFTSISGSWLVPTIDCNSDGNKLDTWVGLDGGTSDSTTVERTGTENTCSGGAQSETTFFETKAGGRQTWSDTVNVGDSMTGSVVDNGGGSYTMTLADSTQGWSESTTQYDGNGADATAEAVIEAPAGTYLGYLVEFDDVTVDGQAFNKSNPHATTNGGPNWFKPFGMGDNGGFMMGQMPFAGD